MSRVGRRFCVFVAWISISSLAVRSANARDCFGENPSQQSCDDGQVCFYEINDDGVKVKATGCREWSYLNESVEVPYKFRNRYHQCTVGNPRNCFCYDNLCNGLTCYENRDYEVKKCNVNSKVCKFSYETTEQTKTPKGCVDKNDQDDTCNTDECNGKMRCYDTQFVWDASPGYYNKSNVEEIECSSYGICHYKMDEGIVLPTGCQGSMVQSDKDDEDRGTCASDLCNKEGAERPAMKCFTDEDKKAQLCKSGQFCKYKKDGRKFVSQGCEKNDKELIDDCLPSDYCFCKRDLCNYRSGSLRCYLDTKEEGVEGSFYKTSAKCDKDDQVCKYKIIESQESRAMPGDMFDRRKVESQGCATMPAAGKLDTDNCEKSDSSTCYCYFDGCNNRQTITCYGKEDEGEKECEKNQVCAYEQKDDLTEPKGCVKSPKMTEFKYRDMTQNCKDDTKKECFCASSFCNEPKEELLRCYDGEGKTYCNRYQVCFLEKEEYKDGKTVINPRGCAKRQKPENLEPDSKLGCQCMKKGKHMEGEGRPHWRQKRDKSSTSVETNCFCEVHLCNQRGSGHQRECYSDKKDGTTITCSSRSEMCAYKKDDDKGKIPNGCKVPVGKLYGSCLKATPESCFCATDKCNIPDSEKDVLQCFESDGRHGQVRQVYCEIGEVCTYSTYKAGKDNINSTEPTGCKAKDPKSDFEFCEFNLCNKRRNTTFKLQCYEDGGKGIEICSDINAACQYEKGKDGKKIPKGCGIPSAKLKNGCTTSGTVTPQCYCLADGCNNAEDKGKRVIKCYQVDLKPKDCPAGQVCKYERTSKENTPKGCSKMPSSGVDDKGCEERTNFCYCELPLCNPKRPADAKLKCYKPDFTPAECSMKDGEWCKYKRNKDKKQPEGCEKPIVDLTNEGCQMLNQTACYCGSDFCNGVKPNGGCAQQFSPVILVGLINFACLLLLK